VKKKEAWGEEGNYGGFGRERLLLITKGTQSGNDTRKINYWNAGKIRGGLQGRHCGAERSKVFWNMETSFIKLPSRKKKKSQ